MGLIFLKYLDKLAHKANLYKGIILYYLQRKLYYITSFSLQYECLSSIYRFIVVTVLIAVIGIECLRLYMGYLGNLTEKVM
jgi:hypothetical protein